MKKLTQAPENLLSLVRPGQVVMYSKATCPYCVRAKGVFNKIQVAFEFIEVDEVPVDPNELKKLHAASGIKTYPNIWIGDRPIGGCSDLISLISRGKLTLGGDNFFKENQRIFLKLIENSRKFSN